MTLSWPTLYRLFKEKSSKEHSLYTPIAGLIASISAFIYASGTNAAILLKIDYCLGMVSFFLYLILVLRGRRRILDKSLFYY